MNKYIEDIRGITAKQWKTAITFGALKAIIFVSVAIAFFMVIGTEIGAPKWAIAMLSVILAFQFGAIFNEPWGKYEPAN